MRRLNLIATTLRGQEPLGVSSLVSVLAELGDPEARVEISKIQGVLTASTKLDPFEVVERTREIAQREPWKVSGLMRLIPVERAVETKVEAIVGAVEELKDKIPPDATYKVVVEKRHTQLSSRELIEAVASRVERKVDLENPSWVVLIEVLGGLTGVSVLRPSQVLSLTKL
ncbi:MAG: THUMP domain-containing protein [Aigarchaeota archaeon]|nr:THUMP domain-containing protein [Aigarchaeota archaeon]MCX8203506.1 THUMP domain-containing protein [Nitrososphaeria archaeon]MDW8043609.1 THUMP domain-containing protein [Nitrososphaerota archaeon]